MTKKMAKKVINSNNPIFSMDENSFDAVGILKSETDKADEFYIYRINNGRLNGGSEYVLSLLAKWHYWHLKWM